MRAEGSGVRKQFVPLNSALTFNGIESERYDS